VANGCPVTAILCTSQKNGTRPCQFVCSDSRTLLCSLRLFHLRTYSAEWKETAVAHLKHHPCRMAGPIWDTALEFAGGTDEPYMIRGSKCSPNTSHSRYLPLEQTRLVKSLGGGSHLIITNLYKSEPAPACPVRPISPSLRLHVLRRNISIRGRYGRESEDKGGRQVQHGGDGLPHETGTLLIAKKLL
jgi:hypothetical protein